MLSVGHSFGAGMVAAVNPYGFGMLTAYLSLYLGAQEEGFADRPVLARLLRALLVGATVSSGFVLLFGLAGVIISAGGNSLLEAMPWVAILIGGVLILLGLWVLAGRGMYFGVFERVASRVGDPGNVSVRGFFLFGLAYGAASLSCTLPVFLAVVGGGISAGGFSSGVGRFFGYGLAWLRSSWRSYGIRLFTYCFEAPAKGHERETLAGASGVASLYSRIPYDGRRSPGDLNEALILPGDAHAQAIFETEEGEPLTQAILERIEEYG